MLCMTIPFINDYRICKNGDVYKENEDKTLTKISPFYNKYKIIKINDVIYRLDELILRTFIGLINLPIVYKDNDYHNCEYSNIQYDVNSIDIFDDYLCINRSPVLFKRIKGSNDFISSNGIVYSLQVNRFKEISHRKNEYCAHSICINGVSKKHYTHRLVYSTWISPIKDSYVIDHLDGRTWNNDVSNLEMVTSGENNLRAYQLKLKNIKWDKSDITVICMLLERGYDITELFKFFHIESPKEKNLMSKLIFDLKNNLVHTDITSRFDLSKCERYHYTVLNDQLKEIIQNLLKENMSAMKIASIVGVSKSVVQGLK